MPDEVQSAIELVVGLGDPSAASIDEVRPWLLEAFDQVHPLPPLGLVIELGRLLLGRSVAGGVDEDGSPIADRRLRNAVVGYTEHVLGRLRNDPKLVGAADAVARMPSHRHPQAIAALAAAMLPRIGAGLRPRAVAGLRRLMLLPADQLLARGHQAVGDPRSVAALADAYETLAANARRAGVLLHDADVFMLENLERLPTAADRLAFSQTAEAADLLEAPLPKRMRRRRTQAGASPSALQDESTYPTGGFASMSTSGSLENLVTSELAYIGSGRETDLFDIRYVTGELLKYTRDESLFLRARRTVVFALASDLDRARVKDVSAPWQRIVLCSGLIIAVVRTLSRWLSDDDLNVEVRVPEGLAAERGRLEMLLGDWVESQRVIFADGGGEPDEELAAQAELGDRQTDFVSLRSRMGTGFPLVVTAAAAAGPPVSIEPDERTQDPLGPAAWQSVVQRLLHELV